MHRPLISRTAPTGLAFEIADLMLLQGWADFHEVQMIVELDHCVEGEEYEEVIAFYTHGQPAPALDSLALGDRDRRAAADRPEHAASARVADAIETLVPARS